MIAGKATPEGTTRFARRFEGRNAPGHYREWSGLRLSSIGVGTYLGEADDEGDRRYEGAIRRAFQSGGNTVDTAINYRFQRSERAVGRALAAAVAAREVSREEVFLSTKAGFLPFDGGMPSDPGRWFHETFVQPGVATLDDVVGGAHCMTPKYLRHQLEASRRNLGVETIDVFHVHNPEGQLGEKPRGEFLRALRDAFAALEEAGRAGAIQWYGTATWNGYRADPDEPDHLDLEEVWSVAEEAGGANHRFRVVQLPYSLAMPEAFLKPTQPPAERRVPLLEAASRRGLLVQSSASILQGRLARSLPKEIVAGLPGFSTNAQRALQFARSTPGLGVALVGMSRAEHVDENFEVARVAPDPDAVRRLVS